ncbi:PE-PPE domain-containing protein [Gordonia sp. 135]|uniref:cutinase family protein n=1 Tax=Gordonia sp. 135 TaxID=2676309 RepID=UPI0012BB1E08|nr:PE-PPE domain-containing protein [Gordonia sp. 135]QGP87621.1 PE-PPE domain-containing protein [Gordonia sp. 135]
MKAMKHLRSRRTSFLIATATGVAVAASFGLVGGVPEAKADSCGAGAVVIVGGTNDPEGQYLVGVKQRYTGLGPDNQPDPNSPYASDNAYQVIYADYPTTLWPLGATGYDSSVAQGTAATKSTIAGYQSQCQGKPVVVAGYSQGARVAGDVLSEIGNGTAGEVVAIDENGEPLLDDDGNPVMVTIDPDVISGELYSDPRRAGDKTGRGIELSMIGVIPGLTMSGPRGANGADAGFGTVSDRVVSVCIDGDPICDLPDPLYDPIGAIDGILGYQTKHFLYPYAMYRDPASQWATRPVSCSGAGTATGTVCMVGAKSAFAELVQGWANDLGYTGEIGDFLSGRPTIGLPLGITLANLQPVVRLVQGFLPPLPQLGYGAYLPDLFVFEDILQGIVSLSPARLMRGVNALAASVRSIVLLPVNFVRYWAGAIVGPSITSQPNTLALPADDDSSASVALARFVATVDDDPETTAPEVEASGSGSGSPAVTEVADGQSIGDPSAGTDTSAPVTDHDNTPAGGGDGTDSSTGGTDPGVTRSETDSSAGPSSDDGASGAGGPDSDTDDSGSTDSGAPDSGGSDSSGSDSGSGSGGSDSSASGRGDSSSGGSKSDSGGSGSDSSSSDGSGGGSDSSSGGDSGSE